jgi:hypothetical protein
VSSRIVVKLNFLEQSGCKLTEPGGLCLHGLGQFQLLLAGESDSRMPPRPAMIIASGVLNPCDRSSRMAAGNTSAFLSADLRLPASKVLCPIQCRDSERGERIGREIGIVQVFKSESLRSLGQRWAKYWFPP